MLNKVTQLFKISLLLTLTSCMQTYNSNSGDDLLYGKKGVIDTSTDFGKSLEIIQSKCINCHTGRHSTWSNYKTELDYVDNGLIIRGSSSASTLIGILTQSGGTMPKAPIEPLTTEEYNTLVNWIDNI